jgi:hypothetical protein
MSSSAADRHFLFALCLILITGCDAFAPTQPPGPEYEATAVVLQFTELRPDGSELAVFEGSFRDPDGVGGVAPSTSALLLRTPRRFSGALVIRDERSVEAVDLVKLLQQHDTGVQVFYDVYLDVENQETKSRLAIEATDTDHNGLPVGFQFQATAETTRLNTGSVRVHVVRFQPNAKNGTDRSGRTLIDVEIPIVVVAPPG